jgi:alkylation response protein AidB-like acyl-CoA dehydrogenase
MNLSLSEEQQLLQQTAQRFVEREFDLRKRLDLEPGHVGFERDHWQQYAKNGWLSITLPEEAGGADGSLVDAAVLIQELAKGLLVEPLIPSAILATGLLERFGSEAQDARYLRPMIDGTRIATLALLEPDSRYDLSRVSTSAQRTDGGFRISGHKSMVWHGPAADLLIVSARDADGITLFALDADSPGIERHDSLTIDGQRASEVRLSDVRAGADAVLGAQGDGELGLERMLDEAMVALGAEALGCMQALLAQTVDYVKSRKQFGQAIGSFQVVQHRLVDMFIACEQVQSLMIRAAIEVSAESPDASLAASALKVKAGQAGRFVGQQAVQLHGGMGMTGELPIGLYFKRLTAIDAQFGDSSHHLRRYGRLSR